MIPLLLLFESWALLALRVVVGMILISYGLPKLRDVSGTGENFEGMGFKPGKFWAVVVAALEFFGGLALLIGFFVQPIAVLLVVQFVVILLTVKRGVSLKEGLEVDLLMLVSALVLMTAGGGMLSLDKMLGIILY